MSSAENISEKIIPEIGSSCLGVLSLAFISAKITDITRMKKYGESGHH